MLKKIFKSRNKKAIFVAKIDNFFLKNKNKILFVVKNRTYFSGNLRVTLESYLKYTDKDIFIYKDGNCSKKIKDEYSNNKRVTVLEGFSIKSLWYILTSGTIILSHNPRDAHLTQKIKTRKIINLWHGVAVKKIELLMSDNSIDKLKLLKNNSLLYDIVIASSPEDKVTNIKAFGVSEEKVKITGLPRYEILKSNYFLSSTLEKENNKILTIKQNKQLVLYAPTFRENNNSTVEYILKEEWAIINKFAEQSNILFGIRPHPFDNIELDSKLREYSNIYTFDTKNFIETNLLLKHVDLLIVDFSSIWIDYLLLNRPIIGFAKDYENYLKNERGFIYNYFQIFPDQFTNNINVLISLIERKINTKTSINYSKIKKKFHTYELNNDFRQTILNTIESK